MTTAFDTRELELQRTPTYKAVFATGPTTFSTHKVRVRQDFVDEFATVSETFAIDEFKVYDSDLPFPAVDHSPVGDMFAWQNRWLTHPRTAGALSYDELVTSRHPVLDLRFEELSGTVARDSSGHGSTGTHQNSPTLGVTGPITGAPINRAITLNGVNQYVSVPDNNLLDFPNPDVLTVECWAYRTSAGAGGLYLIDKGANGYAVFHVLGIIHLWKQDVGAIAASTVAIPLNQWAHVVVTKNGATVKIYIDKVDRTGVVTNRTIVATATQLNIGRYWAAPNYFAGSIARVLLYDYALTATEVAENYDARTIVASLEPYLTDIHLPSTTAPMQIYPEQGACSVGAVLLTITDTGEEATALVAQVLYGQEVTIWKGFHDFDEDDYEIAYKGTVQSVQMTSDLAGYEIQLHNVQSLVNKQLFNVAASYLSADMAIDATVFTAPTAAATHFQETGYVFIDDELIYYGDREFNTFVFVERGMYGSTASVHAADAVITECFVLEGHPIDIVLGIYYGTASKTCLGLGYNDIDWPAFAVARDIIGASYQMQFFLTAAENVLEFLSREIFIPLGCYPFVTADGKLSIKAFSPVGAATVSFDHDSIVATNGKPDMTWGLGAGNIGQIINDVTINYDQNPVTGEYHSYYQETRPASIANYGRFPVTINSSGLRFNVAGTAQLIVDRVDAILDRYEDGAPVVTIRTHLQKQGADVGEIAALTSRLLPNRSTGTRGVTAAKCEIINRSIQWDDGYVEWTLLGQDAQL